ncbi:MAG: hypothetical protein WBG08_03400 [Litorimonas sp.]
MSVPVTVIERAPVQTARINPPVERRTSVPISSDKAEDPPTKPADAPSLTDPAPLADTGRRTADDSTSAKTDHSIGERWRADVPLSGQDPVLGTLVRDLDCVDGFALDCAQRRKEVFAASQLSESDKVWMPTRAHSGLSDARFRGLSEAQIRAELGIPTAGQNGFTIPFSPVHISSWWLDPLYGVNKRCSVKVSKNPTTQQLGETEMVQDCDPLKPAQDALPSWRRADWNPGGQTPDPAAWLKREKPDG